MKVENKRVVSVRFRMTNSKGQELENNMNGPAIDYVHGSGSIIPDLEKEIEGLQVGNGKRIHLSKENGFEQLPDSMTIDLIIDAIRLATEKEIVTGKALSNYSDCGINCICF